MKISLKVSLIASLIVCGTFSSFSFYQYKVSERNIKEKISNNIKETTAALNYQVTDWLNAKRSSITMLSQLITDKVDPKRVVYAAAGKSMFDVLFFADSRNGYTTFNDDVYNDMENEDLRYRDWYKLAEQNTGATITDAYLTLVEKIPAVSVVAPVMFDDDRRLRGVIAADISTQEMAINLGKINFNGSGRVMIINEKGEVIIHPEGKYFGVNLKKIFSKSISTTKIDVLQEGLYEGDAGIIPTGAEIIVKYTPIKNIGKDWMLATIIEKDKLFKNLNSLLINALIGTLMSAIICTLLIYFFMNSIIIKPINALTNAAVDISMGKTTEPVGVQYSERNDEIGNLASGFERMRKSLSIAFTKLSKIQKN